MSVQAQTLEVAAIAATEQSLLKTLTEKVASVGNVAAIVYRRGEDVHGEFVEAYAVLDTPDIDAHRAVIKRLQECYWATGMGYKQARLHTTVAGLGEPEQVATRVGNYEQRGFTVLYRKDG
jgi:hypothetical protein